MISVIKFKKIIETTSLWDKRPQRNNGGGGGGGYSLNFPAFAQGNVRFLCRSRQREDQ
jgi:hypothetical protein